MTAYIVCQKDTAEKVFLGIPLLRVGYTAIYLSIVFGAAFLIIPAVPAWIGAIVCLLVTAVFIVMCVRAMAAANIVLEVGEKVCKKTEFMKTSVFSVQNIMERASTSDIKEEVKKVYEALRYSDYMSNVELCKVEVHIEDHIEQLQNAVSSEDLEMVQVETRELLLLIKERNNMCKMLK